MPRRYKCPAMMEGYDDRIAGKPIDNNPFMTPDNRERYERGWNKIGLSDFMLDAVVIDGVEIATRVAE